VATKKEAPAKKKVPAASPQQTPHASSGANPSPRRRTPEEVAQRAYELWLKRGGQHGSDQDDWLRAERELSGEGSGKN
jgi:hypothetical protein